MYLDEKLRVSEGGGQLQTQLLEICRVGPLFYVAKVFKPDHLREYLGGLDSFCPFHCIKMNRNGYGYQDGENRQADQEVNQREAGCSPSNAVKI